MAQMIEEERLPFIEFEKRYILRHLTEAEKDVVPASFISQDVILITPLGSKDRIEKLMPDHLKQMSQQVRERRIPQKFYDQVKGAYEAWKKDEAFDFEGTPIEVLGLSKNQLVALRTLHVRSVEDLAHANEDLIERLGMGARALKTRAQVYMDKKPEADRAVEMADMRDTIKNMAEVLKAYEKQNELLRSELKNAGYGSNPAAPAQVLPGANDSGMPSDQEIASAVAGAAVTVEE